jgi:glycosyltransferase involved in cell wall biosynthesis
MRILFLSQVLPFPLDAGPKMRSYYVLRHLAQQHEVTLLSFVRNTDTPEAVAHLQSFCHAVHCVPMVRTKWRDGKFLGKSLLTGEPFLIVRDEMPAFSRLLDQLIQTTPFDIIHADQLWMAQYALPHANKAKLVLDQHNAVYLIPQRLADADSNVLKQLFLQREARLMKRYEVDICRQFDRTVWVTKEDRAVMPASANDPVIPICVDPSQTDMVSLNTNTPQITFLGGLHWPPNAQGIIWFAQQVLPKIRAFIPNAQLTVIGKNPPEELRGAGINVTGYVSDLQPYLDNTAVFIVPLQAGGGMRVKILDAWQWGLPIVATTIGAEGVEAQHGHNILLADTAEHFAKGVVRILQDPILAQTLRQNGRQTLCSQYDWRTTYKAWDDVYETLGATA